jgi:hypothetical protein
MRVIDSITGQRFLRRDEDAQILRDVRLGRKSAAHHHAVAGAAIGALDAVIRQVVDFALTGAAMAENADLIFARQVGDSQDA